MTPKTLQFSRFALLFLAFSQVSADDAKKSDATQTADEPRYLLRFQFEEGEQLRYETVRTVTRRHVLASGERVERSKVEQRRLFRVTDVTDTGAAQVTMQFEKVHMESQTDDLPPSVFHTGMEPHEVPKMFRNVAHSLNKSAPKFKVPEVGAELDEDGREIVPEGGHPCFVLPLPETEVAVGDTWKVNMSVKARVAQGVMRDVRLLRTLKLESVADGIAEISTATSIATRVRDPATRAQLAQATPQGTIRFDIDAGRVVSRTLESDETVLGVFGKQSLLTARCETTERLLKPEKKAVTSR